MPEWLLLIPVAVVWFILYWIVGGVVFSMVALFRVTKLRKAQFSCLFTLTAMACAYGATHSAYYIGKAEIGMCLTQAGDVFEQLASVIACGVFPIVIMGTAWFIALLFIGSILLFISRAKNQSWVDEKLEEQIEPVAQVNEFRVY